MAPANAPRPGRTLAVLAALVALLYFGVGATVAWSDDDQARWRPQLGLDLEGGTSITLQPRPTEAASGKVTSENLDRAIEIIRRRVDARGVGEASIAKQGSNIVIEIPGRNADLLNVVKQTAELRFRQVLAKDTLVPQPVPTPSATASGSPTGKPSGTATKKPSGTSSAKPSGAATLKPSGPAQPSAQASPTSNGRAVPRVEPPGAPGSSAQVSAPAASSDRTPLSLGLPADDELGGIPAGADVPAPVQKEFEELTECTDAAGGGDDPKKHLVTCDETGAFKFVLAPAELLGTDIKTATAGLPTNNQGQAIPGDWQVNLEFTGEGGNTFRDITQRVTSLQPPLNQVAVVLDGVVVTDPTINEVIPGGQAQITGGFDRAEAENLASNLRFGALPLAFDPGEERQISPTLGSSYLRAGIIAGLLGLGLVVLYSLAYYRGLGLVTVASLVVAAVITYGAVVFLSNWIGYRLSLAGVAGLIVAIGITADSFVVYFERIRDEVRSGRTLRVAAEAGWTRARRTILAADFVSLLAAVVLYVLSIGSVKGFAFTLGLTTLVDIVVVFLFTKPLVSLLAGTKFFSSGSKWSGLAHDRLVGDESRPAARSPRRRPATPKEA